MPCPRPEAYTSHVLQRADTPCVSQVGELFEVVVFTASLDKYANPVLDLLDRSNSVHYRLFREACVLSEGSLVKDLRRLVRLHTSIRFLMT